MRGLRALAVAGVTASTVVIGGTPARAANAGIFSGNATIGCYGCVPPGSTGNSVLFTFTGTVNGVTVVNAPGSVTLGVGTQPVGVTCVVSSTASGTVAIDGVGSTSFFGTQTGPTVVFTSGWGTGVATFVITSPLGNPCGGRMTATFAGELVGA